MVGVGVSLARDILKVFSSFNWGTVNEPSKENRFPRNLKLGDPVLKASFSA